MYFGEIFAVPAVDSITETIVVLATASIIAGIIVRTVTWWLQRRQEALDDVEQWYRKAIGLVGKLRKTGYQATLFQEGMDTALLHEKLDPLADDLQEHADTAPDGVEPAARIELLYLAAFASGMINLANRSKDMGTVEFFELIQDDAQELYDDKYDIENVNELIESFDTTSLVERINVDENELEFNEGKLDEFATHFSDESLEAERPTSIEEALEMPIDTIDEAVKGGEFLCEIVDNGMQEYVRLILVEFSSKVYESMEHRKKLA